MGYIPLQFSILSLMFNANLRSSIANYCMLQTFLIIVYILLPWTYMYLNGNSIYLSGLNDYPLLQARLKFWISVFIWHLDTLNNTYDIVCNNYSEAFDLFYIFTAACLVGKLLLALMASSLQLTDITTLSLCSFAGFYEHFYTSKFIKLLSLWPIALINISEPFPEAATQALVITLL